MFVPCDRAIHLVMIALNICFSMYIAVLNMLVIQLVMTNVFSLQTDVNEYVASHSTSLNIGLTKSVYDDDDDLFCVL